MEKHKLLSKRKRNSIPKKSDTNLILRYIISFFIFYSIASFLFMNFGMEDIHSISKTLKHEISSKTFSGVNVFVDDESPPTLTAYIESIDQEEWNIKPLPVRKNAKASKLRKVTYPKLKSCKNLPGQWPVDNYPEEDPFLPWIHDVFPSADGTLIHFVAQNKQRCRTGDNPAATKIKKHMRAHVSLFQHISVKRMNNDSKSPRYRLATHSDADPDGIQTRFICRFKPSNVETLSVFPFDYEYAAVRKRFSKIFTEEGFDNHVIWTSQHLFNCPVPKELQEIVKSGSSVMNDYATMFIDLVPIRTPPRYTEVRAYLPPKYEIKPTFNATEAYGSDHILPLIEDSGRWQNIPICKPSLQTYSHEPLSSIENSETTSVSNIDVNHTVVGCIWTSDTYSTRKKYTLGNGGRRLKQWITFYLLSGYDHIYVYDNSGAFNTSLASVTDLFPADKVTRIDWPSKICNNNPSSANRKIDKGERSSQYAAEASCLLRFGPHTKWMSSSDADEYFIPMKETKSMKDLLNKAEGDGKKILTFRSSRSIPVLDRLETPKFDYDCCLDTGWQCGKHRCFEPTVMQNRSILYTYNCDKEKLPKTSRLFNEKQIYRTNHVLMHYIHYSTITKDSELSKSETDKRPDLTWSTRYKEQRHIPNDLTEAVMVHARSVHIDQTKNFGMIGFPWPNGTESNVTTKDKDGHSYNCFVNEHLDNYWIPKFHQALGFNKQMQN